MDNENLDIIRRKKNRHRALLLSFLAIKDIVPKLMRETFFESYRIVRIFDTDKETIKSIVIYFDDSCRMSVSDYFVCAVKVIKKKRKNVKGKSTAFVRSKDLEADMRRALYELGFLE